MLTARQRLLVNLIEGRSAGGVPTRQRDLATMLGIREDSLNKLMSRTKKRLAAEGRSLPALHKMRITRFRPVSLSRVTV